MSSDGTLPEMALANHVFGNYVIESEIGRGGMGAVYVGVHQTIGKKVAIKVLLPALSENKELLSRFFNEARAATQVKHPGIVEVHDFGHGADGNAYIAMEYLQGESLATRLRNLGRLPISNAVAIARQTANALAHAHRAGIVHRDLKPDNVYLVPDVEVASGERVKLLDFGIAKLADSNQPGTARTVTGAILGTPQYMSPEQCEGSRTVDHRTDLYALGCMLFEMLAGRLPFTETGIGGLIGAHLHMPPPRLRSIDPGLPDSLDAIVDRLLAKSPDARFASGEEVANALSDPAFGAMTQPRTIPPVGSGSLTPPMVAPTVPPTQVPSVPGIPQVPSSPPMIAPTQVTSSIPPSAPQITSVPPAPPTKKKRWPIVVGIVALLGGGAAAFAIVSSQNDGDTAEVAKTEGTKNDGTKTDGTKTDGTKNDGTKTDGTKNDGTKNDGTKNDGTKNDGTKTDGANTAKADGTNAKTDGTKADGAKADGAKTDGSKTDGAKTDGTKTDGAKTDGTKTDGAKADPPKVDPKANPKPDPAKKPDVPKDEVTAIKEAFARGDFATAGTACRSRKPGDRNDLIVACIVAGCRSGRIPMAKQWFNAARDPSLAETAREQCIAANAALDRRPLRPNRQIPRQRDR